MSGYRSRMPRLGLAALAVLLVLSACRTTPPPEPQPFAEHVDPHSATFLVIGDSRRGHPLELGAEPTDSERIAFAETLREERPAFVVHAGDLALEGAEPDDWHDFDVDFAPLREAGIAMFPVLGNHEYRGSDGDALDLYFARFPDLGRRSWYVRTFRGVRVVFLDSNVGALGAPRAARQLEWLERRLEEAHDDDGIRAVVLVAHHPPYSNRRRPGESEWVRDSVVPLAARYPKARALFAGHVHSYERFVVEGIACVVTGGAGSPLDSLRGADGTSTRPDLYRGPRGFHYCRVQVGARIRVEVVMHDDAGGWFVADSFEI